MKESKNIQSFFQEKFENLEIQPNPIVWDTIYHELHEKKKRRTVFFWWFFSGVAAGFVLFFSINNLYFQEREGLRPDSVSSQKQSVSSDELKKTKEPQKTSNPQEIKKNAPEYVVDRIKDKHTLSNTRVSKIEYDKTSGFAVTYKEKQTSTYTHKLHYKTANDNQDDPKNHSEALKTLEDHALVNEANSKLYSNELKEASPKAVLEINSSEDKKLDSTKIVVAVQNPLEELLNEKESKLEKEPKVNRWQVFTNIAPIYFSSVTEGSPLDSNLKNNKKSYSLNNQSYGVGLAYDVNKKVKVRAGINILNVDYSTQDIVYYYQSDMVSGKIDHLNTNAIGGAIIIESLNNVTIPFNKMGEKSQGSINQKLGYVEVPLELTYALLNKRFGIDFIGGMSTLFLNKNEIFLQSPTLQVKIGEADNLNNTHFSGNLGLGIKYALRRNFLARVEPTFKYQVNTFRNDSGNFNPYVFGIYTGLNYIF
ncbi:hypothetical protein [Flavobacterium aciduliphilum]|uniref:Outer membrane protein with beta-barrel domain n=1 Tax=Flavobacterium aciduliphilum TaxID=1101402 RepID=A0A328YRU6_9FLAO|nr:hypothetical protein [Flavobacterium aciduliphilum]RAR72826.1 hypothetical protein CLV55_10486 [Flavobacterium aciduliphilum]